MRVSACTKKTYAERITLTRKLGLGGSPYAHALPGPTTAILSLEERRESVRGAFATRASSQVDNLYVLLLDDVLTRPWRPPHERLCEAGSTFLFALTVAGAARNPLPSSVE